ncbi:MAG: hypothetical protein IJL35_11020 [Bacteroidaceae bacterium]|nr:hypothetical protein [Bacteroidaceae bacterium]
MKMRFWMVLIPFAALMLGSCGSDDPTPNVPETPVNPQDPDWNYTIDPEPGFENLTEAQYDEMLADFMARVIYLCISPDAEYNDVELLDHYLNGFAYAQRQTRGIWGQMKAAYDFAKVMKDANVLHRTVLVGAVANYGYSSREKRAEIWRDIRDSGCLPGKYQSMDSDEFWKEFSLGRMDKYARQVYNAVMEKSSEIGQDRNVTGDLAAEMASNKLRHIDLTMTIAPKLLEAGCNVVFAFGDDIISNGQLAYDFVNKNGKLVLEVMDGNMTADTCLDAVNNNLKLISKALEEVVPTQQELFELLSDMSFEQISELNKEIETAVRMYGDMTISNDDLGVFVDRAREILGVHPWVMNFADLVYEASDGTEFEIVTNEGKAFTFYYTDKNENVLLEAKCAVTENYINIRVDDMDERCDLLPRDASLGDVFAIPYKSYANYPDPPGTISLWWSSNLHSFKDFTRKKEDVFDAIRFHCMLSFDLKGEQGGRGSWNTDVNFASDQMVITKGKENTYTLVAEKDSKEINDLQEVHRTLKITYRDLGQDEKRKPKMSDIIELEYHYYPHGDLVLSGSWGVEHVSITIKNLWFQGYKKDTYAGFTDSEWLSWTNRELKWQGDDRVTIYHPFTVTDFTYYEKHVPYGEEAYTLSGVFPSATVESGELDVEAFIVDNREY